MQWEKKEGHRKDNKKNRATGLNLNNDHLRKTHVSDVVIHGPTNPPKVRLWVSFATTVE